MIATAIILVNANAATPKKRKTTDERVHLEHADHLSYDQYHNPGAQILQRNVRITHTGMTLTCDSAVIYEMSNSFMGVGRVKMVQGDTLTLTGDSLYYDGYSQIAEVRRNVVMTHRDQKLYTDNLNYDRVEKKGYFFEGGKMVDNKTVLTSDWGEYHTDTRKSFFNDHVVLENPDFRMVSDTLHYDNLTKWSHVQGPSNIFSGDSRVYTEDGYYNTELDRSRLYGRSQVFNKGASLVADSMHYDKMTGWAEAYGNAFYRDTVNKNIMLGEYGKYNEITGEAMMTGRALAKDYSQSLTDTLFVHADTLRMFTYNIDTDSVYRMMHGYLHARAFRSDVQAVADSMVGHSANRTLKLYKDPIVWSGARQILGEEITAFMNDSTIDSVHVDRQALLVERMDSLKYNQVSGRQMRAYYEEGKLRRNVVDGNGLVVFYPLEEDSTILYQVYLETALINVVYNEEGQLDSLKTPAGDGMMYPLGLAPAEHTTLSNFAWFDYIRPVDKYDLFEWRPKHAGSELKWQPRREAPLRYLKKEKSSKPIEEKETIGADPENANKETDTLTPESE